MNDDPLASALELPVVQMRSLTASLEKLIEHDELLPDQRRKRKAREAIELLRKGGLERFREDHAILQANRQELLRQLKVSSTYERWLSLRRRSDQIRASIGQRQDQIAGLQLREGRLRESLLVEKSKMEARLRELLNEAVSIAITS
jgi:capsule polysaccharide export protein KpsE/RkpR